MVALARSALPLHYLFHLLNRNAMQYSTEQLITMISSNNLAGIHARLIADGMVTPFSQPSVDALQYAINEKWVKVSSDDFFAWFERLFDVPLDMGSAYYNELKAIQSGSGKSPAKILTDQIRAETPTSELTQQPSAVVFNAKYREYPRWIAIVFWALVIIGIFTVGRFTGRLIAKMTE